ncbi:Panacea domain-containing protein [Sphingomonas sp.]|uniref:Panacea domain-containing protein n=1 Tax=Sphingomonas sp. TaxID=28214 RepID=UPI0035BC96AE
MYDVRDVANFILEAAERRGISVTNLALQKLLYFAHGWFFATLDRPLLKNKFEAWQYGPVQRVLYDQFKQHKNRPLNGVRARHLDPLTGEYIVREPNIDRTDSDLILSVLDWYGKYTASQLVDESHVEDGPWEYVWQQAEDSIYPGMRIPDELILMHFKRLPSFISSH